MEIEIGKNLADLLGNLAFLVMLIVLIKAFFGVYHVKAESKNSIFRRRERRRSQQIDDKS